MSPSRVVIVGQGHVGLPISMRAVEVGHDVVGLEVDGSRAKRLAPRESYVDARRVLDGRRQPAAAVNLEHL